MWSLGLLPHKFKRLFWFMLLAEVKLLIIVVLDGMNITHGAQCNHI